MVLINHLAAEVAADESELRQQIVGLIDDDRLDDAKALLQVWDVMSAGDVLKKHAGVGDGRQG